MESGWNLLRSIERANVDMPVEGIWALTKADRVVVTVVRIGEHHSKTKTHAIFQVTINKLDPEETSVAKLADANPIILRPEKKVSLAEKRPKLLCLATIDSIKVLKEDELPQDTS